MLQKKRVLFLSGWLPFPTNNGSKLRIYQLLKGLSKFYDIIFICLDPNSNAEYLPDELVSICQEIHVIRPKPFNPGSKRARLGFLSLTPRSIVDTYSPEIASQISEIASNCKPDLVIASQLGTAIYRESFKGVPAIFEEVEVGLFYERFRNAKTLRAKARNGLTWWKHRRFLQKLIHAYPACTVVSKKEKSYLLKIGCEHTAVAIIPNCIDISSYRDIQEPPQPNTLIFTGSFNYAPNYEAMVWFINDIYPQIKLKIPSIRLMITGDSANCPLPAAEGVVQTGFVEDVRPLIASAWISVVPLLSGGGTRLKILEAMGLHTPVVTTQKGAEGLEIENRTNIIIANNPVEFADCVLSLLKSPELRQKLVENAYQLVQRKYEWSVTLPFLMDLMEAVVLGKRHGA